MHTSNPSANSADKPEAGGRCHLCKQLKITQCIVIQKASEVRDVQYVLAAIPAAVGWSTSSAVPLAFPWLLCACMHTNLHISEFMTNQLLSTATCSACLTNA
jgi:hypothetical protein